MHARNGTCHMMSASILTCHRIRLSAHLGKAARKSEIIPAGATMRTRIRAVVARGKDKAKVASKEDEGSLPGERAMTPLHLKW